MPVRAFESGQFEGGQIHIDKAALLIFVASCTSLRYSYRATFTGPTNFCLMSFIGNSVPYLMSFIGNSVP